MKPGYKHWIFTLFIELIEIYLSNKNYEFKLSGMIHDHMLLYRHLIGSGNASRIDKRQNTFTEHRDRVTLIYLKVMHSLL